jgi:hypothetical protein
VAESNITIKAAHVRRPLVAVTVPFGTTCHQTSCLLICGGKPLIGYCQ